MVTLLSQKLSRSNGTVGWCSIPSWPFKVVKQCFVILSFLVAESAAANSVDSPAAAIHAFEEAYIGGESEKAVNSWDFREAARILQHETHIGPPELLEEPAAAERRRGLERVLKDSLLRDMRDRKVARFEVAQCKVTHEEKLAPRRALVTERCTAKDGKQYGQNRNGP
jgi:hypothetical protein